MFFCKSLPADLSNREFQVNAYTLLSASVVCANMSSIQLFVLATYVASQNGLCREFDVGRCLDTRIAISR
jgi:hypothetical protein